MTANSHTNSELAIKRQQWLEVLGGQDQHSIGRQLAQIAWDAASFAVINEARRFAAPDPRGGVQLNGLVHELLDQGFFTSQLLAIRRLSDSDIYPLEGKRAVWSMTSLLCDMAKHHGLLTRKAIFDAEGRGYDYKLVEKKWNDWCESAPQGPGALARVLPDELNFHLILMRHRDISRLAGITSTDIKPDDTVKVEVFNNLRTKVTASCDKVGEYVNKFLAHAAAPEDRASIDPEGTSVTLKLLREAHQSFCQVASFLSIFVLGDAHPSFVPVPQYNIFQHIERPIMEASQVPLLKNMWEDCDKEWHEWTLWGIDGYEQEFSRKVEAR